MMTFFQQLLLIGPQVQDSAATDGGSFTALGTAAACVAVAIWRRGHDKGRE